MRVRLHHSHERQEPHGVGGRSERYEGEDDDDEAPTSDLRTGAESGREREKNAKFFASFTQAGRSRISSLTIMVSLLMMIVLLHFWAPPPSWNIASDETRSKMKPTKDIQGHHQKDVPRRVFETGIDISEAFSVVNGGGTFFIRIKR